MFIDLAIKKAKKMAKHKFAYHAAIVLRGGSVVAIGVNHQEKHAEMVALKKLWPNKRAGTTLISIRIRKTDTLGMAKPCEMCEAFLRESGVKKVIYSTADGRLETMRL